MIELGSTVKHKYSPFSGKVTGRTEYLDDVPRIQVTSGDLGENRKPVSDWFAETELDAA